MNRYSSTLIADEHGVYDPADATDRMVLGLRASREASRLITTPASPWPTPITIRPKPLRAPGQEPLCP